MSLLNYTVWFDPDFKVEKELGGMTTRVVSLTQTWFEMKVFLKGQVEVPKAYIASVIYYFLTAVSCRQIWYTCSSAFCGRGGFHWSGTPFTVNSSLIEGWSCHCY